MDDWFRWIGTIRQLPEGARAELREAGFVVLPGTVTGKRPERLAAAYDEAMAAGSADDLKVGSATTRMYDFVNRGAEFDEVYVYPPLLEACAWAIGAPFKLSASLGRTLRPRSAAQDLHADVGRDSEDLPMVGFILMVDEFRAENGATRFVPGSHRWAEAPDLRSDRKDQVLACGPAGSLIVFDGLVWHGHTANTSNEPRRSVQGYFVRREAHSGMDLAGRMQAETLARIGPLARYLVGVG
jgi:hypothetical protein